MTGQEREDTGTFGEMENDFSDAENEEPSNEAPDEGITLPYTIDLGTPITVGSQEITQVVFKNRLKVHLMKHIPLDTKLQKMGHYTKPIAGMVGLAPAVIDEMDMADFVRCMNVVKYFLP